VISDKAERREKVQNQKKNIYKTSEHWKEILTTNPLSLK
jgi:hypothetical protein